MPRVFISALREDRDDTETLERMLAARGVETVWDQESWSQGEEFWDQLLDTIGRHDVYLPYITRTTVKKQWLELELTPERTQQLQERARLIVPVTRDVREAELPPTLRSRYYVDSGRGVGQALAWLDDALTRAKPVPPLSSQLVEAANDFRRLGARWLTMLRLCADAGGHVDPFLDDDDAERMVEASMALMPCLTELALAGSLSSAQLLRTEAHLVAIKATHNPDVFLRYQYEFVQEGERLYKSLVREIER